jgi:hypothetical protein
VYGGTRGCAFKYYLRAALSEDHSPVYPMVQGLSACVASHSKCVFKFFCGTHGVVPQLRSHTFFLYTVARSLTALLYHVS